MSEAPLYDDFAEDYDRFVNWPARLAFEMPFFREVLRQNGARTVLDVACGTGQHAIVLAREGFAVTATDLSEPMIERARANAAAAGIDVTFHTLEFGQHAAHLAGPFDAITCLGNSLPHLLTEKELRIALCDFAAILRPGGTLIIQNRNFDRVLAQQQRFMPPETHREGEREWLFVRFYDWQGERLRFNVVRLRREGEGEWSARIGATWLRPWRRDEIEGLLRETGFEIAAAYGSYRQEPFDPIESSDLILSAKRSTI